MAHRYNNSNSNNYNKTSRVESSSVKMMMHSKWPKPKTRTMLMLSKTVSGRSLSLGFSQFQLVHQLWNAIMYNKQLWPTSATETRLPSSNTILDLLRLAWPWVCRYGQLTESACRRASCLFSKPLLCLRLLNICLSVVVRALRKLIEAYPWSPMQADCNRLSDWLTDWHLCQRDRANHS